MDKNSPSERQFEQMVSQQRATIYSVCHLFAKDADEAADLFQETLIRLWMGWATFEGKSSLRTWVYRVTMNTCIDQQRHQQHRPKTVPLQIDAAFFEEDNANPATERLHRRIARLDPFDRAVVLLWLDELSYADMADILGISPDNVGARLSRIREKLKNMND